MRRQLGVLVTLVMLAAPAAADEQVEAIFQRIAAVNPGLIDYSADIAIDMDVRLAFIPYKPDMKGKYYHKRPDRHKLELTKAPSYVKKYPNIFGWHLPKLEKYRSIVQEETIFRGHPVYYIVMLPKGTVGDIQRIEMWVDKEDYSVPRQETHYKNNGLLAVDVDYTRAGDYLVFDAMRATFNFPSVSVKANASAKYSNYRFNQGLSDGFFAKSEEK